MTRIRQRLDTAANWSSVNPTLLQGEVGWESDTLRGKIGTGSARWNALEYIDDATRAALAAIGISIDALESTLTALGVDIDALEAALPLKADKTKALDGEPLGTVNLNTITAPGVYYQDQNTEATTARNYPTGVSVSTAGRGVLTVKRWGTASWGAVVQEYRVSGNPARPAMLFVRAQQDNGVWSAWSANPPVEFTGSAARMYDWVSGVSKPLVTMENALGTADLNTIVDAGFYFQNNGGNSTLARNYPAAGMAGTLRVETYNAGLPLQTFTPFPLGSAGAYTSVGSWQRGMRGTEWSQWRFVPTAEFTIQGVAVAMRVTDPGNSVRQIPLTNMILGSTDLNEVTIPGSYSQGNSAAATVARNYPKDGGAWTLEVVQSSASGVVQRITRHWQAGWQDPLGFWQRSYNGGPGWTSWRFIPSQRINSPAGQPGAEVFTWDDVNGVERQLALTGTPLGTANLNDVVIPGVYSQGSPSQMIEGRNYPTFHSAYGGPSAQRGTLTVTHWGPGRAIQQVYQTMGSASMPPMTFQRAEVAAGTWTPWRRTDGYQRVDNTAGRAVYMWDDTQNREQLIYGDTGWRNITDMLASGWTANNISLRRRGTRVQLRLGTVTVAGATEPIFLTIPSGFRGGNSWLSLEAVHYGTTNGKLALDNSTLRTPGSPQQGAVYGAGGRASILEWDTDDAWPTSLPGTPLGAIPNL